MRGIYQKTKGAAWWIRWTDGTGKLHREVAGTKSAAAKLYAMRKAAVLEGRKLPAPRRDSVTFKELADVALAYSRANKRSWRNEVQRMRKLVQEFGDSQAAMITPAAVEAWLQSHDWSKGTRNRYLATMMFTYKLGVRNKAIGANPLVGIKWASERDRKRIRFLTDIEETRLREVIPPEHLAEFIFALNSGLRLSEQFGLRWEDVAADLSYVTLRHTKNGSIRHARLNSVARAILETRRQASGLIFSGRYTWKWFPKAVEAAGLNTGRDALDKITWHTLRHTFASRLVMAGVPLKTVSNLLGHSSITVTERYAHLAPQHEADAVEMLVKPTDTTTDTAPAKSLRVN